MKKFLMVFFSALFVLSVVGCGSDDDNDTTDGVAQEVSQAHEQDMLNEQNQTDVNNTVANQEQNLSQPEPFSTGKFGRIDINDEKYDTLGVNDGDKVVEGAVFVDVRNLWEREAGQPVEVVKDLVIYEIRNEQRDGDHLNTEFVNEMTTLVNGDKNKKIVLICHTGSRTQKAAKLLLENGFTNVYDIEGGYAEWEKKFHTDSYSNLYK